MTDKSATIPTETLQSALAAAQEDFKDPKKDHEADIQTKGGGSYKFHYADLAALLKANRPALGKHGLSISHTSEIRDGMIVLTSHLMHTSGASIISEYPVAQVSANHQSIGSGFTYARRYNIQNLLNVCSEDDRDAELTSPPAVKSSAQAKRDGVWAEFLSDLEDVESLTGLDRLVRYYEKEVYPTLKKSWRALMDGEFDVKRSTLSKPMNKTVTVEEMSNTELDQLALEKDERDPADLHPLEAG